MRSGSPRQFLFALVVCAQGAQAFTRVARQSLPELLIFNKATIRVPSRRYNLFKNLIEKAFENDGNLSPDKGKGQYDAPGEEFIESAPTNELTVTQRKWRERQLGNGLTPALITGSKCLVNLYLSGAPERDPSNDLYGSKVNISSRDRETGLSLPATPSTSLVLEFLDDGVCKASPSEFTSGETNGQWKLSDDGKNLRFSMDTLGYTRIVETKGSIQKIYWTDEEEKSVQTQTSYSIPPGFVYGDVELIAGRKPGSFDFAKSGILRFEKSTGLFGVSSKLVPCGKFEIRTATTNE